MEFNIEDLDGELLLKAKRKELKEKQAALMGLTEDEVAETKDQ